MYILTKKKTNREIKQTIVYTDEVLAKKKNILNNPVCIIDIIFI